MATVIELNPSPEQREELARGYIEKLDKLQVELKSQHMEFIISDYERQILDEIRDGRAATVGRFQVIKEAAERILGVTKC